VLVVDDSGMGRRIVSKVLSGDPEIDVVGTASNGKEALDEVLRLDPDALTLALELPVMDSLETLSELRRRRWTKPVIVVVSARERDSDAVFRALAHGATEVVAIPSATRRVADAVGAVAEQLLPKLKALCRPAEGQPERPIPRLPSGGPPRVVVVGASTGGPQVLAEILPAISAFVTAPILVVQHMPPPFTAALATSLDKKSRLSVREACEGAVPRAGEVWIARGDHHLEVTRRRGHACLTLHQGPKEHSCRPAADPLFRSAAAVYGGKVLGVILSGVGADGLEGARSIRESGGEVVVQDEASSIAWEMPRAVVEAGLADAVVPISEMASVIWERLKNSDPLPRTQRERKFKDWRDRP
jgi:two-component system chemotaxis response regulator CheB